MSRTIFKIALFLFLVTSPINLWAKDWYVRPNSHDFSYGKEDGTSYNDAWNGLPNVKFDSNKTGNGVGPGDNLWVCGLHVQHKSADLIEYFTTNGRININVSGTDEKHRITIRGDYTDGNFSDPGIVWRAYRMAYEDWVQPDPVNCPNVWSITLKGVNHDRDYFFQDIGHPKKTDFIVLNSLLDAKDYNPAAPLSDQLASLNSKPGYTYSGSITGGKSQYEKEAQFYVHCTDSGNPSNRVYASLWGYYLYIEGGKYITLKNLALHNDALCIKNPLPISSYIRIENCIWDYGSGKMPYIAEGCHHIEIIGCEIAWASNGPYTVTGNFINGKTNGASYLTFSKNYIHDIGIRPINQNSDAHAIALQGGHDVIIEDNIVINCGHAIMLYANVMEDCYNITIRRNFVSDCHQLGTLSPRVGIGATCASRGIGNRNGIKVYQNIVKNTPVAYKFQFEDDILFYNNIIMDCDIGLQSTRSNHVINFDNGIKSLTQWATLTDSENYMDAKYISMIVGWEEQGTAPNIHGQICMREGTATLNFKNGKHKFSFDEEFVIAENPSWYGGIFKVAYQKGEAPNIEGAFFYVGSIRINNTNAKGFHICKKDVENPMDPDNWWAELDGSSVQHSRDFPDNSKLYIDGEYFGTANGTPYREGTDIYAYNNIFYNCKEYFIDWPAWVDAPDYNCKFDKNVYYPKSDKKFHRRTRLYDFKGWQALDKDFDPDSMVKDPNFSNPSGTYGSALPDFPFVKNQKVFREKLTSDFIPGHNSPLIDRGNNMDLKTDFIGRKIIGLPDIGIYEYGSMSPPANFDKAEIVN